jgi:hypothetical protein
MTTRREAVIKEVAKTLDAVRALTGEEIAIRIGIESNAIHPDWPVHPPYALTLREALIEGYDRAAAIAREATK